MSIENTLERIAVALEKIADNTSDKDNQLAPAVEVVEPKKSTKVKAAAKEAIKAAEEIIAAAPVEQTVAINKDTVEALLRKHAQLLGAKTTIALMTKHGADKVTPKIATIPEANYEAVINEATADIKKVEKK